MFECAKWQDAIRQGLDAEGVTPRSVFQRRGTLDSFMGGQPLNNSNELNVALGSTHL
jgi:hypothetical protein